MTIFLIKSIIQILKFLTSLQFCVGYAVRGLDVPHLECLYLNKLLSLNSVCELNKFKIQYMYYITKPLKL